MIRLTVSPRLGSIIGSGDLVWASEELSCAKGVLFAYVVLGVVPLRDVSHVNTRARSYLRVSVTQSRRRTSQHVKIEKQLH